MASLAHQPNHPNGQSSFPYLTPLRPIPSQSMDLLTNLAPLHPFRLAAHLLTLHQHYLNGNQTTHQDLKRCGKIRALRITGDSRHLHPRGIHTGAAVRSVSSPCGAVRRARRISPTVVKVASLLHLITLVWNGGPGCTVDDSRPSLIDPSWPSFQYPIMLPLQPLHPLILPIIQILGRQTVILLVDIPPTPRLPLLAP